MLFSFHTAQFPESWWNQIWNP